MHESVRENGMATMKPLLRAAVPAKGELEFKQGGKHLMIWGINGAAVRAGKLPMAFVFTNNNNERILFDMVIKPRSEEHTSELQSLMRISYAVFCLKKKRIKQHKEQTHT